MYESPINEILGEMQITYENECMKVVQSVGFDVNKEELTKALQYDRNQYEKGHKDGYEFGIDEFAEKLCTNVDSFVAEVNGIKADLLTLDYFSEFVFEVAEQLKGVQE